MSDLGLALDRLTAPGGGHPTTVPTVAAAGTMRPASTPPKGWEPGVKYRGDGSMEVTSIAVTADVQRAGEAAWRAMVSDLGLEVPHGFVVRLAEAKYDPAAWHRDKQGEDAVTKAVWRYKFVVEADTGRIHADDVDRILAEVLRRRRPARPAPVKAPVRSLNVVYADPQAGKVAMLGGSAQLAARVADCFDMLTDHLRDLKKVGRAPDEAAWLDAGDCIESFNNVRSQAQTNDLTLTQQVRFHRRVTMHGLDYLAGRFDSVKAATCGSNHARNRDGKDPLAGPQDDWGVEILSQVQDAYACNPGAYGHVGFAYPPAYRETLCLELGGLPVGLAHGHQVSKPEAMVNWWRGQTFGEQPVSAARVLVTGHFHHFAAKEVGNGRLWVMAPTIDAGSDWFTARSGEVSTPGILVFSTTEDGWDDLRILRPTGSLEPVGGGMAA